MTQATAIGSRVEMFVDHRPNLYSDGVALEHFYTNATIPSPAALNILLSFPMRFVEGRRKIAEGPEEGLSETMFMTSPVELQASSADPSRGIAWRKCPRFSAANWTHR